MLHSLRKYITKLGELDKLYLCKFTNAGQLYLWKLLLFNISVLTTQGPVSCIEATTSQKLHGFCQNNGLQQTLHTTILVSAFDVSSIYYYYLAFGIH